MPFHFFLVTIRPMEERTYSAALTRLRQAGLRPTRQRMALAKLLWAGEDRHVTADELFAEAREAGIKISHATIYNTLHQFTEAGLLKELSVEQGSWFFDTNVTDHHHFYDIETKHLTDIHGPSVLLPALPETPEGMEVEQVDLIIKIKNKSR